MKNSGDIGDQYDYNKLENSLSLSNALNDIGLNKLLDNNSRDFTLIENPNPMIRDIIRHHNNILRRIHGPTIKEDIRHQPK